jgi:GAF domain-containing protein
MVSRNALAPTGGAGHAGGILPTAAEPERTGSPADLAHLSQAERAARALAAFRPEKQVSIERALLGAVLDLRQTLRVVVSALVPKHADWCFVDLIDGDGIPRRVEVAHADPAKAPLAAEMRSISLGPGWATPSAQAIRDRSPRLLRDLSEELMQWATHDERHLGILRAMKPNSLLATPLVARDRVIGAITVLRSTMQPGLSEDDLVLLEELAVPAALALDDARWYQAERAGRAAAEEDADRERQARADAEKAVLRLRRLESASASFAGVLSTQALARVAIENGLSALGFSSATVVLATPSGFLDVLHAQGWPDDVARDARRMAPDAPALVAEAFRIQTAIWLPTPEALQAAYPNAGDLPRRIGDAAWAAVPLRVDGRTVGAMAIGFPHPRELDADEKRYVLTVAQQLAQALERARLRDLDAALRPA